MKHIFPFIIILVSLYVYSCANQGSPQGGPKDTIPPILVKSIPANKSLNYKDKVFEFEFDERINADKLTSKLNITPRIENKFKVFSKKNKLILTFEESFADSTTYTLNFADGVGDLTENNPVENFSFAFSTGSVIDSIYINGRVNNLYDDEIAKDILIAIYDIDDTLDLFTGKPKYFTKTNELGLYNIENIKNANYKLYAFLDDNNNLTNEPKDEPHGFKQDTLNLNNSIDSLFIKIQLMDASQPKFVRAKNTGQYFDVLYNKFCYSYEVTKVDSLNNLNIPASSLFKENTIIRFYKNDSFQYGADSLQLIINFSDSLKNQLQDTIFVKFNESKRKSAPFKMNVFPEDKNIEESLTLKFKFDKPIKTFNSDSLIIKYDTIQNIAIPDSIQKWNTNKTILSINLILDKELIPKINEKLLAERIVQDSLLALIKPDTTIVLDTLSKAVYINPDTLIIKNTLLKKLPENSKSRGNKLDNKKASIKKFENHIIISINQATFISVDNDSTEVKNVNYKFKTEKELGILRGKITTTHKNYFLQLTNPKFEVIQQLKNPVDFQFNNVKPGKYTFRILIDNNNDGDWSPGNILKDIQPESIWFFEEVFDLRANWEVENLDITF
jgi:hypothetical protein